MAPISSRTLATGRADTLFDRIGTAARMCSWLQEAPLQPGPDREATTRRAPHLLPCLLILLAASAWSAWRGQDVNWDLQNYHQYDPFALLHGRLASDVAPAGPQSFLNPLPYLLPYGLHRLPPLVAGLLVTASQAICLMLAWFIAWTVRPGPVPAAAATLAAITGPIVLGELGSSFADLVLAIPPLASILLVLRPPAAPGLRDGTALLLAGACTGIAIGLKPTSLFLLPALAACAAMGHRRALPAMRCASLIVVGAAAGALASDGAWAGFLWRAYGSPLFPFLNTVFRSHSAALVDFSDPRFRFTGWRHALAIPFALASGSSATSELPIRDGRLALALCLGLAWALARLSSRRRDRMPDPLDGLCAYVLIGLAGWLLCCPIQRYAAVLEIVSGLLSILLLARLPGRRLPLLASILAAVLLAVTTRPCDYFHRPWRSAYRPRVPAAISADATYGLLAQPLAYWVTAAPYPAHAFGLASTLMETGGALQRRLDRILGSADDRLWLLDFDVPVDTEIRAEMAIHRIVLAPPCLRAASMVWLDTVFCRGVVAGSRPFAASDLAPGRTVAFSRAGDGLIYEIYGFDATEADGTWAIGPEAMLALHLDDATRAAGSVLLLRMAGVPGAPVHRVTVSVAAGRPRTTALAPSAILLALCILPAGDAGATVPIRFSTADTRSLAQLGLSPEPRRLAFRLYDMTLRPAHPGECGR